MKTDATPKETKRRNRKTPLPRAATELAEVAKFVSGRWAENPWLTIKWTDQLCFELMVDEFTLRSRQRSHIVASRPQVTLNIRTLEAEMDTALRHVKGYLSEKFGTSAKAHYAAFGIRHYRRAYIFPEDQDERSSALDIMLEALSSHQFEDNKYGLSFWTSLNTRYKAVLAAAREMDGACSIATGNKNLAGAEVRRTLNAIIQMLKGHYPDNWKAELRYWGFHKEKY